MHVVQGSLSQGGMGCNCTFEPCIAWANAPDTIAQRTKGQRGHILRAQCNVFATFGPSNPSLIAENAFCSLSIWRAVPTHSTMKVGACIWPVECGDTVVFRTQTHQRPRNCLTLFRRSCKTWGTGDGAPKSIKFGLTAHMAQLQSCAQSSATRCINVHKDQRPQAGCHGNNGKPQSAAPKR